MTNLEALTRRQLLKKTAAGVAGSLVGVPLIRSIRPITVEEALTDPNLRQHYLDQRVERESSPFVERVVYNHYYTKVPLWVIMQGGTMYTPIEQLGTLKKRDIYVLSKLFDILESARNHPIFSGLSRQEYARIAEEVIMQSLKHEYRHAGDFYHGIKLTDELVINSTNHAKLAPEAVGFVMETRAYLEGIDYAKKFGEGGPTHISALGSFAEYLNQEEYALRTTRFKPYEKQLIIHQIGEIERKVPQIKGLAPEAFKSFETIKRGR